MRATNRTRLRTAPRRRFALLGLLVVAVLAAGCGDEDESTVASDNDAVTGTSLDPGGDASIPDLPEVSDPTAIECTAPPRGTFDSTAIVGESIDAAMKAASEEGCTVRVAVRDGEPQALTQDYRPDRTNVAVEDGTVTEIVDYG